MAWWSCFRRAISSLDSMSIWVWVATAYSRHKLMQVLHFSFIVFGTVLAEMGGAGQTSLKVALSLEWNLHLTTFGRGFRRGILWGYRAQMWGRGHPVSGAAPG